MKQKYMTSMAWIIKLQWQTSKLSFIWSIFFAVYEGLRSIVAAYAIAKLLSSASAVALRQAESREVYVWLAALLVLELSVQLSGHINTLIKDRAQQKLEITTNEAFFTKMYELSQEQFDNQAFNTRLDRARESLMQLWRLTDEVFWMFSTSITFFGSIASILIVSPIVGMAITVAVIPAAIIQIRQNKSREEMYKQIEPYDRVAYRSRWMLIDPNHMPEIRLMNAFKHLVAAWRKNLTKSHDLAYANSKQMAVYGSAADTLQPIVSFGANIYLFKLLLAGTIGFDRFIFLRSMLEQAHSSAGSLASTIQRLHELSINLQNFSDVYNTDPSIPNGKISVSRPLSIEFKNVDFAYPGTNQKVLNDVSFVIAPGSKLALVGENGAGKTTLIKLLLRQYLPSSGSIIINGHDIRDIEQESYYSAISNLSQDFLIVSHLSIEDNLVLGLDNEPSKEEIRKATDLVDATHFINKLPRKIGTRLDTSFDDGTNLSGGQNQRLGVARALLRKGDIMILDEPTSAIDAKAEYLIFNNIYKAHESKTTLIVSHRFSTVRKADKIIVMEQGSIIEYGSHEELLEHGGLYKEMFETQAEGYK